MYDPTPTAGGEENGSVVSRGLMRGTVLRHKDPRNVFTVTLARRKDDDSGWWCVEGGGLDDRVINVGSWEVLDVVKLVQCYPCHGTGVRHAD